MLQIRMTGDKTCPVFAGHSSPNGYESLLLRDDGYFSGKEGEAIVGQHVFQYVGTIKKRKVPEVKTPLPFVVGQTYLMSNGLMRLECVAVLQDQVLFQRTTSEDFLYRTKPDGTSWREQLGKVEVTPEFSLVPAKTELYLDKTGE